MEGEDHCHQLVGGGSDQFRVRSQSDPSKFYTIDKTGRGLVCDCPDHRFRKADCKHIKVVLEHIKANRLGHDGFRIMERSQLHLCKYCDSGNLIKKGVRKTKKGESQMYQCKDCKRRFLANFGFERMRYDDVIITRALQMYFTGMSVRDIAGCLEQEGIEVSPRTVYNWVCKYSEMVSAYLNGIVPRVGDWFRADEVWIKVAGTMNYLFASMDDDTRFWLALDMANNKFQYNADNLLMLTKLQAGKNPKNFITDGLPAYAKSSKRVFGRNTTHVKHIHLAGKRDRDNNNKMERLNGEIRDREKVFRGLKKSDTPIIKGMWVYYNFTKKHGALNGQTPAENAKIDVDGKNKWKTLIQNAALHRTNSV